MVHDERFGVKTFTYHHISSAIACPFFIFLLWRRILKDFTMFGEASGKQFMDNMRNFTPQNMKKMLEGIP